MYHQSILLEALVRSGNVFGPVAAHGEPSCTFTVDVAAHVAAVLAILPHVLRRNMLRAKRTSDFIGCSCGCIFELECIGSGACSRRSCRGLDAEEEADRGRCGSGHGIS